MRSLEFKRLFLLRDGLTAQDKIEIARAMLPLLGEEAETTRLRSLVKDIEDFKVFRNALAHGRDVSEDDAVGILRVEIVSRSGKEKIIEITPESHERQMASSEVYCNEFKQHEHV